MLRPGDKLGSYEIVTSLKSGGMATLYLARRKGVAGFARHVAIKVVHPHLAEDRVFVDMFLDEARLSARIQHPNVVHVEELGEDDGTFFLVMEYVHGCPLSQLQRGLAEHQRRLAPELAAHVVMRVAEGLHAAHETRDDEGDLLGVVHRDISPQNVLLSYAGHVKLIDFGIAKARGRVRQTTHRSLKGKIRYMAPEQATGSKVDRRTDVYALGIVLWELLTMRRLFAGDDEFDLLKQVQSPTIPRPSELAEDIPAALEEVCLAALGRKPDQRPDTALDFRNRLVAAVPTAASLDATQVATVLRETVGERIEQEKTILPKSVTEELKSPVSGTAPTVSFQSKTGPLTLASRESDLLDADDSAPLGASIDPAVAAARGTSATRAKRVAWAGGGLTLAVILVGSGWIVGTMASGPIEDDVASAADVVPEAPPEPLEPEPEPAPESEPPAVAAVADAAVASEDAGTVEVAAARDRAEDRARDRARARTRMDERAARMTPPVDGDREPAMMEPAMMEPAPFQIVSDTF